MQVVNATVMEFNWTKFAVENADDLELANWILEETHGLDEVIHISDIDLFMEKCPTAYSKVGALHGVLILKVNYGG